MLSGFLKGKIIVFDRSHDMLRKARENIDASKVHERIKIIEGDITDMHQFADGSIDHIVSIYSPLSFIYAQDRAAQELNRVLKHGGRILAMSHGYFNAVASKINNYRAHIKELRELIADRNVKWAPHVPKLITHSKETIERLFADAGFKIKKTYGIPVFTQPGPEDFDPENKTKSAISSYLDNPVVFDEIFKLEMQFNNQETVCNRGMNIFLLAQKS